jgi:hypothetical protein
MELMGLNVINPRQTMEILASLDFPIANRILTQIKDSEEDSTEVQQVIDIIKQMAGNPQELMGFLQLPIEEILAILEQSKAQREGQPQQGQPIQGGVNNAMPGM